MKQELAETVIFKVVRNLLTGHFEGTVAFLCPNCDQIHGLREIDNAIPSPDAVMAYPVPCGGEVRVAMPWANRS